MSRLNALDYVPACVGGVELAVFGAEQNRGAPVIFVSHGRGGAMAHVFANCRDLVSDGFIAIAFDQRNHGRRLVDATCNSGWSKQATSDTYAILAGTALDVSLLIDFLPACLGIATDRVGMTGFSLGGHATFTAMSIDPRIQVGVPVIGCGDRRLLMENRARQNKVPEAEMRDYFPAELDAVAQKYDAVHHPERFADRPLLMLSGGKDTVVPLMCNERLHALLKPLYTHPERLRLSVYPDAGHEVPPAMWAEARAWFKQWLGTDNDSC